MFLFVSIRTLCRNRKWGIIISMKLPVHTLSRKRLKRLLHEKKHIVFFCFFLELRADPILLIQFGHLPQQAYLPQKHCSVDPSTPALVSVMRGIFLNSLFEGTCVFIETPTAFTELLNNCFAKQITALIDCIVLVSLNQDVC